MNNWLPTRLGDLIKVKGGLSYKSQYVGEGDAQMVGMGCVSHKDRFIEEGLKSYSGEYSDVHILVPGDLVIATRQQSDNLPILGFPAKVPLSLAQSKVFVATNMYKVFNASEISNDFLFWLLRSADYKKFVVSNSKGTTVRMITKDVVENYRFLCPPLEERQLISRMLDDLQDKIELNRRMNETLEEMARSLFRDWFVNFGPTRRQMEGATDPAAIMGHAFPPEKAATLAALFPAKQGDDGLPEGWEMGSIGDLFTLQRGFDLPTKSRVPGTFPVIAAGGVHGSHSEAKVTGPGVVTGRSGVIGEVQYVASDYWPLNTTLWVKKFKRSAPFHCYFFLQTLDLKSLNSGSAVPSLNRNHVHAMAIGLPAQAVISQFDLFASTLFKKIEANQQENQTLAEMRDLLLPKLMSGEIRLKDVEAAL